MSDVIPFEQHTAHSAGQAPRAWSTMTRLAFRFLFTYLALSAWFWLFAFADKSTALVARPWQALWRPFALWTAAHVYHWTGAIEPVFVRDTRYLYALLTCLIAASLIITLVWSALDRKRREYVTLNLWMRIFLRYVLAYLLLHYGMDKVFLLQFPAPSLARLTERLGDYSPSSLMWAFIGSSTLFTVFGGLAEILGAVLLLARRTTTLGALIGFAVMFNVTMMDFSYDVSVKIFCLNILLMATYLILPDVSRLLNFFFLNKATQPANLSPSNSGFMEGRLAGVVKILVLLLLIAPLTYRSWKSYHISGPGASRPPLYGLYEVEEFTLGGIVHPPLITDAIRWRYLILEEPNVITLKHMDESLTTYRMQYDPTRNEIRVSAPGDTADKSSLKITEPGPDEMTVQGTFNGLPLEAKLHRIDASNFTLVNRGFHWISESSFIR